MNRNALKYFIVLAILSVTGIFLLQFAFLKNIREITEKEFEETTTIALQEVAWQILAAAGQTAKFDNIDPVEKVAHNLYLVNVNDVIDQEILRQQLAEQFKRHSIRLDYEYAVSDPVSGQMVYREYVCAHGDSCDHTPSTASPGVPVTPTTSASISPMQVPISTSGCRDGISLQLCSLSYWFSLDTHYG